MCLAVPAKVLSVAEDRSAVVDLGGVRRGTSLAFCPDATVGDYVLIHAGYAIQKLDEEEAKETLSLLEQMAALGQSEGEPLAAAEEGPGR